MHALRGAKSNHTIVARNPQVPDTESRTTIQKIVRATNFNYVATVVAGLVLTAATGALGGKPAALPPPGGTGAIQNPPSPSQNVPPPANDNKTPSIDPQKQAFQKLCGFSYIGLGIICLIAFVIPSPTTHDLVKTVGLTTLGFAGTIIGRLSTSTT
jgi:hypothetical protein